MPRRAKQQALFDEKLDPPLVKAADRYVELTLEKQKIKERLEIQAKNLIGLMHKASIAKIRHAGQIIEISLEAKEKLKMHPDRIHRKKKEPF